MGSIYQHRIPHDYPLFCCSNLHPSSTQSLDIDGGSEGLLAMAGILCNSEIFTIAWNIRHDPKFDVGVIEMGKTRPEVKDRRWGAMKDVESNKWVMRSVQGTDMGAAEHLLGR